MPRAHGKGTSTPRERGAYGNKRGKERQLRRTRLRMSDPRVIAALAETRAARAAIEALLVSPPVLSGPRPTLTYVKDVPVQRRQSTRLSITWRLSDAIALLEQGYQPEYVARRTGYDLDIINELLEDE